MKKIALSILVLLVSGCGSAGSNGGSVTTSSVNGKSAGAYYGQFVTPRSPKECAASDKATYTRTTLVGSVQSGDVNLILYSDGKAQLEVSNGYSWSGTWSVVDLNLNLDDEFLGKGLTYNGIDGLALAPAKDSADLRWLQNQYLILLPAKSERGCGAN